MAPLRIVPSSLVIRSQSPNVGYRGTGRVEAPSRHGPRSRDHEITLKSPPARNKKKIPFFNNATRGPHDKLPSASTPRTIRPFRVFGREARGPRCQTKIPAARLREVVRYLCDGFLWFYCGYISLLVSPISLIDGSLVVSHQSTVILSVHVFQVLLTHLSQFLGHSPEHNSAGSRAVFWGPFLLYLPYLVYYTQTCPSPSGKKT